MLVDLGEYARGLPNHIKLSANYWYIGLYDRTSTGFSDDKDFVKNLDNILLEQIEDKLNGRNGTRSIIAKKYQICNNIITNIGMQESIDRDLGNSSTVLDWASVGTSATSEVATQTDLQAEDSGGSYARRVFSTAGSSARTNQTMKLGISFNDSQVSAVPITLREAGVHWHITNASSCHARVVFSDFTLDTGDLFVFQINELQENGTV